MIRLLFFIFFLFTNTLIANIAGSISLSKPLLLDLNGDNIKEILITSMDGKIHAYNQNGLEYKKGDWPVTLSDELGTTPNVVYDKKGNARIGVLGMNGKFFILDTKGKTEYSYDTEALNGSIVSTGDYNNDGKEDFGFGLPKGRVYLIDQSGSIIGAHPVQNRISSNIMAIDWDEDSKKEIIFSADDGTLYAMKNGNFSKTLLPNTPKGTLSTLLWYGDATNNNSPQLVYSIKDKSQHIQIIKVDQNKSYEIVKKLSFKCKTNILYGDFDNDGKLDAVVGDSNNRLHFLTGLNKEKSGYPKYVSSLKDFDGKLTKMDVDNDGKPELIFLENGYIDDKPFGKLVAYSLTDGILPGYPKDVGKNNSTISIGDLDGDGKLEIIVVKLKKNSLGLWETKPFIIKTNGRVKMKMIILGKELEFD